MTEILTILDIEDLKAYQSLKSQIYWFLFSKQITHEEDFDFADLSTDHLPLTEEMYILLIIKQTADPKNPSTAVPKQSPD
jgi:hypothetical protein